MRALVFLVATLAAGCGKSRRADREPEPPPDRSTPVRPSVRPAEEPAGPSVGVGDLWNAYQDDAAAAARRYGDRPLVRVTVDSIDATASGFVVKRSTLPGVTHRMYFPKSAAGLLEGSVGKKIEARGRVVSSGNHGLLIRID